MNRSTARIGSVAKSASLLFGKLGRGAHDLRSWVEKNQKKVVGAGVGHLGYALFFGEIDADSTRG